MAGKKKSQELERTEELVEEGAQRPRLKKLSIRNFRAIGDIPVVIELDEIVVLVGPNNSGKSSILRAYEVVVQQGGKEGWLSIADFPNSCVDPKRLPEIELEMVVPDEKAPGETWISKDPKTGEMTVREKWTYTSPGVEPIRVGWDVGAKDWHTEGKVPWGAAGVAKSGRPEPHRIEAFASPEEQAKQIVDLLKKVLADKIEALKKDGEDGQPAKGRMHDLHKDLVALQKQVASEANTEVAAVEDRIGAIVAAVFPGHKVVFDAKVDDIPKISWFSTPPSLRMGPAGGYQPSVEHQGSGARRTLLWAALRIVSEDSRAKRQKTKDQPHLLLMDEPELCLHPNAIREACKVLYDLPKTKTWQVMVTTHSPIFIDLSRDNTSVVRVERNATGEVQGTTIYRPDRAQLDPDDRARLKMLNAFDPYVAEFFFGGRVVLVEGDTEYAAFAHVIASAPDRFKDVHVIRARGKATIATMCKILNQFGSKYAVLHDSDRPTVTTRRTKKVMVNPAWSVNRSILSAAQVALAAGRARLIASVPNFEEAFFDEEAEEEKPYIALEKLKKGGSALNRIESLLTALIDSSQPLPTGAIAWDNFGQLENALAG